MPITIKTIEDTDKEFSTIKSHMGSKKFSGDTEDARELWNKLLKLMQTVYVTRKLRDVTLSGDWNYTDILFKPFKNIPYQALPDESIAAQKLDYAIYNRIESINGVAVMIMYYVLDEYARKIFDSGIEKCPDNHLYISCRYGMEELYKKYSAKTLMVIMRCRTNYLKWYFDQTLDPADQFRELTVITDLCEELNILESAEIRTLTLFSMLQKNELYAQVVTEFSAQVDPDEDFLTKITFNMVVKRITGFYSGSVYTTLKNYGPAKVKELKKKSLNWMDEEVPSEKISIVEEKQQKEIETLTKHIMKLSEGMKRMELQTNPNKNDKKDRCPICKGAHAGECMFKSEDACKERECVGKGMFGARHCLGCKHFVAGKGFYCHICGKNRVIAAKCTKECAEKMKKFVDEKNKQPSVSLLGADGEDMLRGEQISVLTFNPYVMKKDSAMLGALEQLETTIFDLPMFVCPQQRFLVDRGAIVSAAPPNAVIPGTFMKKELSFQVANGENMISMGHGLVGIFMKEKNSGKFARLIFPVFVFEESGVLISEGMFHKYGYEFSTGSCELFSKNKEYIFDLEKVEVPTLSSFKWYLTAAPCTEEERETARVIDVRPIRPSTDDGEGGCMKKVLNKVCENDMGDFEECSMKCCVKYFYGSVNDKQTNYDPSIFAVSVEDMLAALDKETNSPTTFKAHTLKDINNWKFEKMDEVCQEMNKRGLAVDKPTISCYNDVQLENMHEHFETGFTPENPVEKNTHLLHNEFIWSNACFNDKDINRDMDIQDAVLLIAPHTRFCNCRPSWKTAPWHSRTYNEEIIIHYPAGTFGVFSAEDIEGLTPKNAVMKDGRVLFKTQWGVDVTYRDRNTVRRHDDLTELHNMWGHPSPSKLFWLIQNIPELKKKYPNIKSVHHVKVFCRICYVANVNWIKAKQAGPSLTFERGRLWFFDFKIFHLASHEGYTCYLLGIEKSTGILVRYFLKEKSEVGEAFESFKKYLDESPQWAKILGPSPITQICVQTDNEPVLVSAEMNEKFHQMKWLRRVTREYVHPDAAFIENAIGRVDRINRINFASAPWLPYTLWPGSISYAVDLVMSSPSKGNNGRMQAPPVVKLDSGATIRPPIMAFGQLIKNLRAPEKLKQISLTPKMIPKATLGYYLCQKINTIKSMVFDIDSQTIVSAARVEPAPMEYSFRHSCVALPLLPHSHGLEVPEWNIIKSQISGQKSVVGKWVVDLSTHMCTNDNEIYGVVKIRTTRNTEEWFLLNTFLSGRPDRTEPHKKMLYSHLDKYLEYRKNKFHPIFVRTKITLAKSKKETRVESAKYPGIICSYHASHPTPFGTLLFEDDDPRVCQSHDCAREDVEALNQSYRIASIAMSKGTGFCTDPGIPRDLEHARTFPEPYRTGWINAFLKEYKGMFIDKQTVKPCSRQFMEDYMKKHPNTLILRAHVVKTIKPDGTMKVRVTGDGGAQKRHLQRTLNTKSPYLTKYYSSTVNDETLRFYLWWTVQYPVKICFTRAFDYSQAYLNTEKKGLQLMFFRFPPGLVIDGQKQGILKKYIYGMLESGLRWNETLHESIMKNFPQFRRNESDPTDTVYILL